MFRSRNWRLVVLLASGASFVAAGCDWDSLDARLGASASGGAGGAATSAGGGDGGDVSQGGGTTGGVGGASGPGDCGRISLANDPFDGVEIDALRWLEEIRGAGSSAAIVDGSLNLVLGAGDRYNNARLRSRYYYDMREGSVAVEVTQALPQAEDDVVELTAARDGRNAATIRVRGSELQALRRRNDQSDLIATVTYSSAAHRWWRIRHAAGTVFYEFSGDGTSWTALTDIEDRYVHDFEYTQVVVDANWQSGLPADMMPRTAVIGELVATVNEGAPDGTGWCKSSAFTDDFEGPERDGGWLRSSAESGTYAEQSEGEVLIGFDWDDDNTFYEYRTARAFDLTDSFVSVEMPMVATEPDARSFLEVVFEPDDDEIEIGVRAYTDQTTMMNVVQLRCIWKDDGTSSEVCPNVDYDPTSHRFFRIREDGGTLFWEVSGDGNSYEELGRLEHPFALENVWVRFGGSANTQLISPPPDVRFDNYNRAP